MNDETTSFIHAILAGAPVRIVQAGPRLNPAEKDLADALVSIARKHGPFDESGCGIYASYEPGAINETQNIGVMCKNCVLYNGGSSCKIISLSVEATGKCRFAVIPDGVVKSV
jgi:hypothetical protein